MATEDYLNISERVRQYLTQHFNNRTLRDDDDIFAQGFVTSLFAMQLVMFVEKEFGIQIDSDDLEIDNFRSVTALSELVNRKKDQKVMESGITTTT